MMERIGDHLTYLSEYATGNSAFQDSEKMQKVRVVYCKYLVLLSIIFYFYFCLYRRNSYKKRFLFNYRSKGIGNEDAKPIGKR